MTDWPVLKRLQPFLQDKWNFESPTDIQKNTADLILDGSDLIAESPTGTGKTLAYVLPIVNQLDRDVKNVQAVILAPSRELAMQIFQVVTEWIGGTELTAASLIGGANVKKQQEKLKKKPQVIVGTPGRIHELIKAKKLKMHEVKTIVLDETDQLLVPEHTETIQSIIKTTLRDRQLLCFSATLSEPIGKQLLEWTNGEAKVVRVSRSKEELSKVEHQVLVCDQRDKVKLLQKLSRLDGMQALVFIRDIGNLSVYAEKLNFHHVDVGILHSEAKKLERSKVIEAFQSKEFPLLLATDIAARGLDIKDLPYVIHADLPDDKEAYTHRSGRTGRAGKEGKVLTLAAPPEEKKLRNMAKELGIELVEMQYTRGQLLKK
ncbi:MULTISPECIES: DEAD/DEAH box helicase [Bacillus]|uniref:RNA helicase n=2 Tax=Bacillus TaxID=1386 RepID=A0A0M4FKQ9_9BACI|nr:MULTISPECIES: DEAD/DEAH box helicase [Bacillus]ALC84011.1 RNA helicase [Bacillus gobiensis]MBP1082895.1 superfamily II DNA/RNA helicase [Bacillus capparidis]MED1098122.1 DEAD/DEAH box helicase [Bacillus capparidis]